MSFRNEGQIVYCTGEQVVRQKKLQFGDTDFDSIGAVLIGGGTDAAPILTVEADKKFQDLRTKSTGSGCSRQSYLRHFIALAGAEGECLRVNTIVNAVNAAGGVHGAHVTLTLDASGEARGLGCGLRATLEVQAPASPRTVQGTYCALQVESFIAATNTMAGPISFIRVVDTGAVAIDKLFEIPANTVARKGSAVSSVGGLAIWLDGGLAYLMYGT